MTSQCRIRELYKAQNAAHLFITERCTTFIMTWNTCTRIHPSLAQCVCVGGGGGGGGVTLLVKGTVLVGLGEEHLVGRNGCLFLALTLRDSVHIIYSSRVD